MFKQNNLYLSALSILGTEQKFTEAALDVNWTAPMRTNVALFEDYLKTYLEDVVHFTTFCAGTVAFILEFMLFVVKACHEIICKSLIFKAFTNPILYDNAISIFFDSKLRTWNFCQVAVKGAILDRTKLVHKQNVIVTVHFCRNQHKINQ